MTRHRFVTVLVLACAIVARAQQPLPASVVQAPVLPSDAPKQIADFVAEPLKKLESAEFKDIKSARERLLEPLKGGGASVAFRTEYSRTLIPPLAGIASGKSELNAVNALRLMGELGTADALDELEKRAKDRSPPLRYAAFAGISRVLDSIRDAQAPAVLQGRAGDAVTRLGEALGTEANLDIAGLLAHSLSKLLTLERQGFETVRTQALTALTRATKARAAALAVNGAPAAPQLPMLTSLCTEARNAIAQANPNLQLTPQGKREVAEIGGDCISIVLRAVKAGQVRPEDREDFAKLADTAESAILLAAGRQNLAANLGPDLRQGNAEGDKSFLDKVVRLLTTLSEQPLSFPPDRFLK